MVVVGAAVVVVVPQLQVVVVTPGGRVVVVGQLIGNEVANEVQKVSVHSPSNVPQK